MGNAYGGVQGVQPPEAITSVSFHLNGKAVVVQGASPSTTLNDWLRTQAGLTGTKRMCGEGGCGCCVVTATISSQIDDSWDSVLTEQDPIIAINSVSFTAAVVTVKLDNIMTIIVFVSTLLSGWMEYYYSGGNREVSPSMHHAAKLALQL